MKRRMEKIGATTALTGSLLAFGAIACSPEKAHSIEAPATTISAASSDTETPLDSPQNRVGRCVLVASKLAILEVMNSPRTVLEHDNYSFDSYFYKPETSSVMIDDSVPNQTTLVYSINVHSGTAAKYSAMGRITLPVDADSVKQALGDLNPDSLSAEAIGQTIDFKTSGVTQKDINGDSVAGTTINKVYTPDQATADCAVVEDFTEQLQQEYGS